MTVDNDMGNRAGVVETTCDNDDGVDDDAAPAAINMEKGSIGKNYY